MRDGYDRFAEYALRAWNGQRRHGLSGVGNVRGGVWVVLKLEWQPLHPRAPPAKSCSVTPLTRHPMWMLSGDVTLRDCDSLTFSFSELSLVFSFICTIFVIIKIFLFFTYTLYIPLYTYTRIPLLVLLQFTITKLYI